MPRLPTPGSDSGNWGTLLNEYLEVEHAVDGSHKTQHLPLAGGTLSGDLDVADHVVSHAEIRDYSETVVTSDSGNEYTLDLENGNIVRLTLTDTCILSFTNPPATGKAGSLTLILIQDNTGNRALTWPGSVKWAHGLAPTLSSTANSIDIVQLVTIDGGTTWFAMLAGKSFS